MIKRNLKSSVGAWKLCLTLSLIFSFSYFSDAQNSSNKGTEFWVGFPKHRNGTQAGLYLYITSDSSTTGTVSIPGQSWSTSFSVTANQMTLVNVPSNLAYVDCDDCIQNKGIKVNANKDVVVYSHIYRQYGSDATLVLPVNTLGKEYYCMSYEQRQNDNGNARSQFMIIADKDDTKINITPSVDLRTSTGGTHSAGTTYSITLDAGEVYQGRARDFGLDEDVSGTFIEVIDTGSTANCRTVAVFSGSSDTYLGCRASGLNSRDNLYQQMYPTKSWGTRFITVPFKGRTNDDVRVLAKEDNTSVLIYRPTGIPIVETLDAGEHYTLKDVSDELVILAGGPIMVAQYQKSQTCRLGKGDPSMTILNPIEQTLTDITLYSSRYEDIDDHYINVVIHKDGVSSFRIDGSTANFNTVTRSSAYRYAQIDVSQGNHRLTSDIGFVAVAYGFGDYESYGYAAGANVKDLTATIDVANTVKDIENFTAYSCLGTATEFEGAAEYAVIKWVWDFGDGDTSQQQNPKHTYKDTGVYEVKLYTYKAASDGCSDYDSTFMDVRVYPQPEPKWVSTPRCEKSTVQFYDSSVIPAGEELQALTWKFHSGADQYISNPKKYYDTTGRFAISLTVKTKNGCEVTYEDSITISPLPVASFDVEDICFIDTLYVNNTSTVRTGGLDSFRWIFSANDTVWGQNPQHFYSNAGKHYVELEVTSDSGCKDQTLDSLIKRESFTVDFEYKDTCLGFNSIFTNQSTINGGQFTDTLWTTSDGDVFNSWDLDKTFNTPGDYDVKLLMEQDSACRDSLEVTVSIHPQVSIDFELSEWCLSDSTSFLDKSSVSTGSYTLAWDFDDGLTSTATQGKIQYASQGTKTVELTATSDNGCEQVLSKDYLITNPQITDILVENVCLGSQLDVSADLSNGLDSFSSYDWKVNGSSFSSDSTFQIAFLNSGKVIVELDLQTKNGCSLSGVDSLFVIEAPVVDFTVTSACEGVDLITTNMSTTAPPSSITGYTWRLDGSDVSSNATPNIDGGAAGTKTIELVVENDEGCRDSLTVNADVHPLPAVGFNVSNQCLGQTTNFIDASSVASGSNTNYDWTIDAMPYSGTNVSHLYGSVGNFAVKLVVTTDQGCQDSLSRNIDIHPLPEISLDENRMEGCLPFNPGIVNNSTISAGSITDALWEWGDGNTSTNQNPSHTYANPGSYTVKLRLTSDQGCIDSITLANTVVVHDVPTADFTFTPEEPSVLTANVEFIDQSSADVTSWNWFVQDQVYSGNLATHSFKDSGSYFVELKVENDNGCRDSVTKTIYVNADLFVHVPTGFSPNGDGKNDLFGLEGLTQGVFQYKMEIYDRWGALIFKSDNVNDKWDGTYQGEPVPPGMYVYMVQYTNPRQTKWFYQKDVVHLIK
jgi:gliding motility-associated-like protein